jgi:hypothetical protein
VWCLFAFTKFKTVRLRTYFILQIDSLPLYFFVYMKHPDYKFMYRYWCAVYEFIPIIARGNYMSCSSSIQPWKQMEDNSIKDVQVDIGFTLTCMHGQWLISLLSKALWHFFLNINTIHALLPCQGTIGCKTVRYIHVYCECC